MDDMMRDVIGPAWATMVPGDNREPDTEASTDWDDTQVSTVSAAMSPQSSGSADLSDLSALRRPGSFLIGEPGGLRTKGHHSPLEVPTP